MPLCNLCDGKMVIDSEVHIKWEHIRVSGRQISAEEVIDFGEKGWQLCAVNGTDFYFKRPKI